MNKPKVFISHVHAEAELAQLLNNDLIDAHLLRSVEVFVSSDSTVNPGGTSWLKNIEDALIGASVLLIVASPRSISKPWINIEAGAAWLRSLQARNDPSSRPVYVMPLCHSGLTPGALPLPWSTFNAVEVRTSGGLQQVLETIALAAGIRAPKPDLTALVTAVQALEQRYVVHDEIERHLGEVLKALGPGAKSLFTQAPPPDSLWKIPLVRSSIINLIDAPLLWLKANGHIDYQTGPLSMIGGGPHGGYSAQDVMIAPTATFLVDVLPHLKL